MEVWETIKGEMVNAAEIYYKKRKNWFDLKCKQEIDNRIKLGMEKEKIGTCSSGRNVKKEKEKKKKINRNNHAYT